ncbi:MAG TPA: diaminopimelate epimerase, partial [Candidatus Cybelea sp.]
MMRVPLTKMHGAHNDFVILDQRGACLDDLPAFARWACDRRGGIGADGVIALGPSSAADVRMRTINADGSEAEMCGNGIRCAARWLDEAGEGDRVAFETEAGVIHTEIVARGSEYLVRVDMGWPRVASPIPVSVPIASFVDLGNPHVVVFESTVDALDLDALANAFQAYPAFASGTNVHLAAPSGEHAIQVRHWERGVGQTQACGTGAVACAAVAIVRYAAASPVEVFAPGGKLVVEWDGKSDARLT